MKQKLFFFLLVLFSLPANAFYVGGSAGHSYSSEFKNKATYSLYAGGNVLPFLKVEALSKYNKHLLVGGGGRLTVFPFINVVGGVVHRFSLDKSHRKSGDNGFYAGPSFNFNLLPVVDLFVDAKYFAIKGDHTFDTEAGVRFHF